MDKKRLMELAGVEYLEEVHVGSDIVGTDKSGIEEIIAKLAKAIYDEAVELAKDVYESEGPGKSGAKTKDEYIKFATKNFLQAEYKRAILKELTLKYDELVKGSGRK